MDNESEDDNKLVLGKNCFNTNKLKHVLIHDTNVNIKIDFKDCGLPGLPNPLKEHIFELTKESVPNVDLIYHIKVLNGVDPGETFGEKARRQQQQEQES